MSLRMPLALRLLSASSLALLLATSCGGSGGGVGGAGGAGGMGGSGGAGEGGSVPCGDMTCTGGSVCVVQVDDTITRFCAADPCTPKPLSCDCVPILSLDAGCGFDFYCVSATDGQISCMPYPDGGEADAGPG